jgi:hypothetical protein
MINEIFEDIDQGIIANISVLCGYFTIKGATPKIAKELLS